MQGLIGAAQLTQRSPRHHGTQQLALRIVAWRAIERDRDGLPIGTGQFHFAIRRFRCFARKGLAGALLGCFIGKQRE